jgi:hypothetical protein
MLRIESDDKVEFILRYLPSLVSAFLACVVIVIIFVFLKRKRVKHLNWKAALLSLLVPVLIWAVYFVLTAKWTLTLTLLNSENEQVAESAYVNLFAQEVDLDKAVRLAVNVNPQEPNLRFYATCRIADILATNSNGLALESVKKSVENAPIIVTDFFGTNELNYTLYTPGRDQLHISVADLIEKRMKSDKQ